MIKISSPSLGRKKVYVHLTSSQEWVISINGSEHEISSLEFETLMSLLPFLEIDFLQLEKILKSDAEIPPLPIKYFIRAGFIHGSPHWVSCALNWLEHSDLRECEELVPFLEQVVSTQKKYSQKIRHIARRLISHIRYTMVESNSVEK